VRIGRSDVSGRHPSDEEKVGPGFVAAGIVLPGNPADDLALRFADAFDGAVLLELRVLREHGPQRIEQLADRLLEFQLTAVGAHDLLVERLQVLGRL